jgi:hypothetical protein
MNIDPKKASEKAPNVFMALMGDRAESLDEFNDGVEDEESSQDSLTATLPVKKEDNQEGGSKTTGSACSKSEESDMQPGIYEQMDEFDVPDEAIGTHIGELTESKLISGALEGFVSLRKARKQLVNRIEDRVQIDKMLEKMERRKKKLQRIMATSPFQRRMDKLAYVFGTTILVAYSYLIGKFPHTTIYSYVTVLMICLLCHRYYTYWSNGYFYYLYDFCYIANFCMLMLLNFAP